MFFNKFFLFSPVQRVSKLIVRKLVTTMNIQPFATRVITGLFHNSMHSIRQVGLFPTITALRTIRLILKKGAASKNGIDFGTVIAAITTAKRNKNNVTSILGNCIPDLFEIIKNNHLGFTILYDFFFAGFFLYLLKPLLVKIFRMVVGMILSSIGVLLNEMLSSIPFLSDLAVKVVELLESHTSFKIPRFTSISFPSLADSGSEVLDKLPDVEIIEDEPELDLEGISKTGLALYGLGIFIAGVTSIVGVLIVVDHFNHELITNTPVANDIVQSTYAIWDTKMKFQNLKLYQESQL